MEPKLMLLNPCFLKLGTGLSIMMAKRNPSLVTTFAFLSCGYVCSSYQEVKSVVLHTLNRARLNVAIDSFLKTGRVPTLNEGNRMEKIFGFPWSKERPVVLGPRFKDAFQDPNSYLAIEPIFEAHVLLHIIRSSNQASLVLESIEKMIIRCLCLLLLILKLILLNLIRSSQLYMRLLRAKLQNRLEISWRDAKYDRRIQELSFSSFFIF
ncbi:protein root UVB sensitive 6-like isoform X1 [Camellia sinensis]|uniref:protein root UVB sensitive 6-like isoform X1 n=2 Tax=Camellia sinensis TaxID=4442 RepID=UPI001035D838|nr:protein root UVB sensitive 6-like isoform X1 [Camellia sinensis]XP_028090098.1 protein root UVB sensitive 6-like isoform X1 [Camellia sinensis]XP_028090100.1 protein root UVB sensitive 6-like isoform X1 [Camellia sinensis]XP_028090101.1 protein root UVB sensitive 6-like isoform X1 [Camellia sinensis]XP_028090102.1 protein root UVB sensitive 6-like isoform X1 [Camellia sinensis]XP_028090103.1 protein root UVB sensitive 6-like isoform X1 [Camellia sinensis]XP_028090104.1 protein root UVB sen